MARVAGRLPAWALGLLCATGPVAAQTIPQGDVFTDSYDVSAVLIPVFSQFFVFLPWNLTTPISDVASIRRGELDLNPWGSSQQT